MRLSLRFTLPSVQTAIAIALTMTIFSRPESETYVYMDNFGLQLGFALNAPATALRYSLESLAMQFCPATYEGNSWTGCYPLAPIFETVVYFGLVWLLWYAVALEAAGGGAKRLDSAHRKAPTDRFSPRALRCARGSFWDLKQPDRRAYSLHACWRHIPAMGYSDHHFL